jgi:uncharacterized protein (TIGR00725 family)
MGTASPKRQRVIAVIGAKDAPDDVCELAFKVGRAIARKGAVLLNGGLTGVMEAAAAGARDGKGHTIGILPGDDQSEANPYIEFAIVTALGKDRNAVIVRSADAIIALAGKGGTLAEIGLAKKFCKPIVALDSWPEIGGLKRADTPAKAVALALKLAKSKSQRKS